MNFLVTHAQKYDPVTTIFDLGGSYQKLTTLLGGSTWRIGLSHRDFTINPFCLEPTPEHLHFLFSFVRVLLQSSGQYQLSMTDDRDLYEAIENLYALDPPQRRLITLANTLPRSLAQHLHRWVQGGPYANLFDNAEDTLTFQRVQCFDFEGLDKYPLLLAPLLFYVLHRASAAIHDAASAAQLKLFVLDEAWRFAEDADAEGVHHRGAQDLAQAQRRDDPRHAEQRGSRTQRPAAHGRRELPDEVLPRESRRWTSRARASCSI